MSAHVLHASLSLLACTWLLIAFLVRLACGALEPMLRRGETSGCPRARARRYLALALAPAVAPTVILAVLTAPGTIGVLSGRGDHCLTHLDHVHFCLFHASTSNSVPLAFGASVFLALVAWAVWRGARILSEIRRQQNRLDACSPLALAADVRVVSSNSVLALTTGMIWPRVWLASSLVAALSDADREVVLAHERAQLARRDPARFALACWFAGLHRPVVRDAILAGLALATEQCCDADAAHQVGDRFRVAETLLRVERLTGDDLPIEAAMATAAGLGVSTIPARVKRLLAEDSPDRREARLLPALAAGLLLAALLALPLHHAAEHLVGIMAPWL